MKAFIYIIHLNLKLFIIRLFSTFVSLIMYPKHIYYTSTFLIPFVILI